MVLLFRFQDKFLSRLRILESQPIAFGNLTVRSLLDMREHCLMEFDFHDVYLKQKQLENKAALASLPSYLARLHSMEWRERQEALALGILAGNVFDWGAKEVALLMEADKMDFEAAKKHVGPRPWLIDNVDGWIARMEGPAHSCVCIFIDNSGGDFILGMISEDSRTEADSHVQVLFPSSLRCCPGTPASSSVPTQGSHETQHSS